MPRAKLQRPTEEERLAAIAKETSKIIRAAMVRWEIYHIVDLAALVNMDYRTLSYKFKNGSWTQKDLCRMDSVLKFSSEEAVKMLGVRL